MLRDSVGARNGTSLEARIRLREMFEAEEEAYSKLKLVYWGGLEALTDDGRLNTGAERSGLGAA
jgi:hypothetical protein